MYRILPPGSWICLCLFLGMSSAENDRPVISLNLEAALKSKSKLGKAHANKQSICHTKAEWKTLLYGGEPGFSIPQCVHDDSGVKLIHAVRCEVSLSNEATCPEPKVNVVDHHEGDISHLLRMKKVLCIKSAPNSKPKMVNQPVKDVDYKERGEYLFTYSARDTSGNEAEEVQFAMILEDKQPPVFNDLRGLPPVLESLKDWKQHYHLNHIKGEVADSYDGDVSNSMTITQITQRGKKSKKKDAIDTSLLGDVTVAVEAHDMANIFGKNNLDNTASLLQTVRIVDSLAPTVLCKEALDKPLLCTKQNCSNACACGDCPPLDVDCAGGIGEGISTAACIDYHDSWDPHGSGILMDAVKPTMTDQGKRVIYTCTDSSNNTAVASRVVRRLDVTPPQLDLPLLGMRNNRNSLDLDLQCGSFANSALIRDAVSEGVGYHAHDNCDAAPMCSLSLFEGNCGGEFTCLSKNGAWTGKCDGGQHKALATMAAAVNVSEFVAPFMDGELIGTYGLKYTCSDRGQNIVSRCRTIRNIDTPFCNPAPCGAGEYKSAPATRSSDRKCTTISMCSGTQYEQSLPTPTSDRLCAELTWCAADEYQSTPPSSQRCTQPTTHKCYTSDRKCSKHSGVPCDGAIEFEFRPPSFFMDRVCKPHTVCKWDQYESSPPNAYQDRVCKQIAPIDCVPGWGDFKKCKTGVGNRQSKIRTETEPQYHGKACPVFDYNTNVEDMIYLSSFNMDHSDISRIRDPVETRKFEERLIKKLSAGPGGVLLEAPLVQSTAANVYGREGVDIAFLAKAKFEQSQHCQDIIIDAQLRATIPHALKGLFGRCVGPNCGMCSGIAQAKDSSFWHQTTSSCSSAMLLKSFYASNYGATPTLLFADKDTRPVDCVVSEWTRWGKCSATCGGGERTRMRSVNVAPVFGGLACPLLSDVQECNSDRCISSVSSLSFKIHERGGVGFDEAQFTDTLGEMTGLDKSNIKLETLAVVKSTLMDDLGNDDANQILETAFEQFGFASSRRLVDCPRGGCKKDYSIDKNLEPTFSVNVALAMDSSTNRKLVRNMLALLYNVKHTDVKMLNGSEKAKFVAKISITGGAGIKFWPAKGLNRKISPFNVQVQGAITQSMMLGVNNLPSVPLMSDFDKSLAKVGIQAKSVPPRLTIEATLTVSDNLTKLKTIKSNVLGDLDKFAADLKDRRLIMCEKFAFEGQLVPCIKPAVDPPTKIFIEYISDCHVGSWSSYSTCTTSCGTGSHTRTRTILKKASNGGRSCPNLREENACGTNKCVSHTETKSDGDLVLALGLSKPVVAKCQSQDELAGAATAYFATWAIEHPNDPPPEVREQLMEAVKNMNMGRPSIDLSDPEPEHFAQNASFAIQKEKKERFTLECAVDCQMTNWTYGRCSAPCGSGLASGKRSVIQMPAHGGQQCGSLEEMHLCNTHDCASQCKLQKWMPWTLCSAVCNGGTQCRDSFNPVANNPGCPATQCQKCNTHECGKCGDEGHVGIGCSQRPYCCDSKNCYASSKCGGRKGIFGDAGGQFCEPDWYSYCSAAAMFGKPCTYETKSGGGVTDAQCARVSLTCPAGQLLTIPPTRTADAKCTKPSRCTIHQYIATPAILPLVDKTCAALTVTCNGGRNPLKVGDRSCGVDAPFCDTTSEYISEASGLGNDAACETLSTCSNCKSGEQLGASDRVCLTLGFDGLTESDYLSNEVTVLQSLADATEQLRGVGPKISNVVSTTASLVALKAVAPAAPLEKRQTRMVCTASRRTCTACSACCNKFVSEKISRCGECVRDECTAAPTPVPTAVPTSIPTARSKGVYRMFGDRLVVDLAIKSSGGSFAAMMQQSNFLQPIIDGVQSDSWRANVCLALKQSIQFKEFDCAKLHVYSVNCASLRTAPQLIMNGPELHFVSASNSSAYRDPGATCTDEVDGPIAVNADGRNRVDLTAVGVYKISYSCTNTVGKTSKKKRIVVVKDNDCPSCVLAGNATIFVEASFPFVDQREDFKCHDMFHLDTHTEGLQNIDVEQVGEYKITYSATDAAGNTNTACGAPPVVRTIKVIDTLKPVLGIRYGGSHFWQSSVKNAKEISPITGKLNPVKQNYGSIFNQVLKLQSLESGSKSQRNFAVVDPKQTQRKPTKSEPIKQIPLLEIAPQSTSTRMFLAASMAVTMFATVAALLPTRTPEVEEV